jgi:TPR repeat protein
MNPKLAITACLSGFAAMMASASVSAQAPSPRACDAARGSGRVLPGCRRPQQLSPLPRQTLPPGAVRIRDALASVPEAQWQRWDDARLDGAERIWALGTLSDVEALAQSGNRRAQYLLGYAYRAGSHGAPSDGVRAEAWNRQAAEAGDARAQFGMSGIQTEADARWLRRAAQAGHSNAMYHLGLMLAEARGVARNDAEAVRWFRRSAADGHEAAMAYLGIMFMQGRSVARDDAEAVRWFRRSVDGGGCLFACYFLGRMYAEGRGIARDDAEAVRLYRASINSGDNRAGAELDRRGIVWRTPIVAAPSAR